MPRAASFPCASEPSPTAGRSAWSLLWRRTVAVGLLVFFLVESYQAIWGRENDYRWHTVKGEAFLRRDMQALNADWYPLGRMGWNALVALLPYRLGRGLMLAAGVAALVGSYHLWGRMAGHGGLGHPRVRTAALLTTLAGVVLLQRELDECGLQLVLLGMLSVAAWLFYRGRELAGAAALAAAATYKTTPLLFLPYLVWKRRFRAAAAMAVVLVGLNLLPALYLSWENALEFHGRTLARFAAQARLQDPSQNTVEPPNVRNQSLTVALARYLQTYGEDHPLYLPHPAFVQFGRLSPQAAGRVVKAAVLLLALVVAWKFWPSGGRSQGSGSRQRHAWEWAVATGFTALLSPLCWKHHLVLILPAYFLLVLEVLRQPEQNRGTALVLWVAAALMILPGRALWGRELSLVLVSYKPYTAAALLVIGTVLARVRGPFRFKANPAPGQPERIWQPSASCRNNSPEEEPAYEHRDVLRGTARRSVSPGGSERAA